jgi:hypothetical protein
MFSLKTTPPERFQALLCADCGDEIEERWGRAREERMRGGRRMQVVEDAGIGRGDGLPGAVDLQVRHCNSARDLLRHRPSRADAHASR